MVGIAGRSKACRTCKRRKIKCDETKPICMRCRKAYMMCEGYADEGNRTFVDESAKFTASTFILQKHGPVELQGDPEAGSSNQERRLESPDVEMQQIELLHPEVPPQLGLSGFEINICVAFTTARLFPGATREDAGEGSCSWVIDAVEEDTTRTVYYAACGLSMAYFGHMNKDPQRLKAGAIYYGYALTQLKHNLEDSQLCWNSGNIAAAILLVVYELSVFNSKASWIQHAGGLETLIRTRGPHSFKTDPARKYYTLSRFAMIARALTIRRRTFLEDEEWQTVPWEDSDDVPKQHLQYLLDILSGLPGMLEDSDAMHHFERETQTPPSEFQLQALQSRLVVMMGRLFEWRYKWEELNPSGAYEVDPKSVDPIGGNTLKFDSLLYYRNFHSGGRAIVLYDAGLLLALDLAQTWKLNVTSQATAFAKASRPPTKRRGSILVLPHETISIPEVANEVRRSTQYHLQGRHVNAGAMLLLLPLRLLARYSYIQPEKLWLVNVIQTIAQASGFTTSGNLLAHVQPTETPPISRGAARSPNAPFAASPAQNVSFLNIMLGDGTENFHGPGHSQ